MGLAKGSKVIQPGDKEVRNVYDVLLEHKKEMLEGRGPRPGEFAKTQMALEFVEELL